MNLFQLLVPMGILIYASQSYAISSYDCYSLDRKSNAYQTCMLRVEIAEREYRLKEAEESEKRKAKEKEQKTRDATRAADKRRAFDIEMDNLEILGEIDQAEESSGYRRGGRCIRGVKDEMAFHVLSYCGGQLIVIFEFNPSHLIQEFSSEIENKKIEAIFIGGLNVVKSENYGLRRYPKGVVVYIELKDSPDIFNEIARKIEGNSPFEVFFRSEKQSAKILISP